MKNEAKIPMRGKWRKLINWLRIGTYRLKIVSSYTKNRNKQA